MDVVHILVNDYPTEIDNLRHIGTLRESSSVDYTLSCLSFRKVGRGKMADALQVQCSYGVGSIQKRQIFAKYISRRKPA
jgi:hypothetical protein